MSSPADVLAERLFASAVSAFDLAGVYLGDRLGFYRSLDAGFGSVEVLPIENDFFRFYRLRA